MRLVQTTKNVLTRTTHRLKILMYLTMTSKVKISVGILLFDTLSYLGAFTEGTGY